jgi:hypothetical protein
MTSANFKVTKILCAANVAVVFLATNLSPAQAQQGIRNPSGACGVRTDGSRAGYHNAAGTMWVPDCQNPLQREYWRVFVKDGSQAFIIPRPDGAPELRAICADPRHELRSIADRYMLCTVVASNEHVRLVNTMSLSDALEITHFLHGQLKFSVAGSSNGTVHIRPFPMRSDIVDACEFRQQMISLELDARCQKAHQPEGLMWVGKDREAAEDLASRLNELYGIR